MVYKGRPGSIDATRVRELKASGMGATEIVKALKIGRTFVPCHRPPYFTFGINLANSGSGINPSRFGISILGRLSLSSFASAGTMPFKFKM